MGLSQLCNNTKMVRFSKQLSFFELQISLSKIKKSDISRTKNNLSIMQEKDGEIFVK